MLCIFHRWSYFQINNTQYRHCKKCDRKEVLNLLGLYKKISCFPVNSREWVKNKTLKEIAIRCMDEDWFRYSLPNQILPIIERYQETKEWKEYLFYRNIEILNRINK